MKTGEKRKILVIDDEAHVVTYLTTLLEDHGYTTVTATNGREGIEIARVETPDLVCLDITMPEESGIRFYRNLRMDEDIRATPVFVVTAVTGYGGDPEAFRNFLGSRSQVPPPEGFFSKPIEREVFLQAVEQVMV